MDIDEVLTRGVEQILPSREGLKQLMAKKKIKLYLGIDPTATNLHLGHTVMLRKLQQFADLGHEAILLFGTGTVLVGDPSQRATGRKLITQAEIDKNVATWKDQVKPIIDFNKVKIMYNAEWLLKLNLRDIIKIASHISAVQLFKREMFQRRLKQGDTVWYHETMYPLLQGYDSVVMDVDLELGGTDQTFNMLVGRELQQKINGREKFVLAGKMIMGTDGQPMSKTSGNCIWLTDSAQDMFAKLMAVRDELMPDYFEFFTD
ncbi:tyrosine--tRNA ligase, partial [Candidatus Beckwithbacteria bacterium RIFCSPLOWO2_02_FULL_47_23]